MCFSATASFSASLALGVLGVGSLRKAKDPSQFTFAGIPFVFAIQQFSEGIVWMSMTHPAWAGYQSVSSLIFLLIAQVVWPIWMPLAFLQFEKDPKRKKILKLFLFPGVLVSLYFLFCLFSFKIDTTIANHHIFYNLDFPGKLVPYAAFLYLISTFIGPLFSRDIKIKGIGITIFGSYLVSRIFFQPSLISVWCFFAVVVGALVYLVMRKDNQTSKPHPTT